MMGIGRYILDGHKVIEEPDRLTWARWIATYRPRVSCTYFGPGVKVSTVFLGLDHRFLEPGPPLVFETLVFGGQHDGYMTRASTWDEALEQHAAACELVKQSTGAV